MKKILIPLVLILLSSCANRYTLHSNKKPFASIGKSTAATIESVDGITLVYDDAKMVEVNGLYSDKVIFEYNVKVKNNSKKSVQIDFRSTSLNSADGIYSFSANLENTKNSEVTLKPGKSASKKVYFETSSEFVSQYSNSSSSAFLYVDVDEDGKIEMPIWVWKI